MLYGTAGVLDNYPSDGSGVAPSSQGQAESAWTVRATNPTSTQMVYLISATCVTGIPIKTGVWLQTYAQKDPNGNDAVVSANCPDSHLSVLTGGGFQSTLTGTKNSASPGVVSAYPSEEKGVANKGWHIRVFDASGTIYVVCAQGVIAEPLVGAQDFTLQSSIDLSVSCPEGEALVGGGYFQGGLKGGGFPMTVDSTGIPDITAWHVGHHSDGGGELWVDGICVQAQSNAKIPITFSNYRHLLRIPADRVVVATDGSGQVKGSLITARVTQARSSAISAQKTINPFTGGVSYIVPSGCGDPTAANNAAIKALKAQLTSQASATQIPFGAPTVTINRSSLTCSPSAGTQQSGPFTYTQAVDGIAAQATYSPEDVRAYQRQQLEQAVRALGGQYTLDYARICPQGTQVATVGATQADILCAAGGVVEWNWTTDALKTLARSLAGESKEEALRMLDATPGVEPGKSTIDLPNGARLPTDPNDVLVLVIPVYGPDLLLGLA
jgi:hypothetical protein